MAPFQTVDKEDAAKLSFAASFPFFYASFLILVKKGLSLGHF